MITAIAAHLAAVVVESVGRGILPAGPISLDLRRAGSAGDVAIVGHIDIAASEGAER